VSSRLAPQNVQQIGDELAIAWSDGGESFLRLEALRRACPCAGCGGEPDVVRPEVRYTLASFALRDWANVGGYALQLRWGDGHDSGLYTFPYLQRLGQAAVAP
jgi:DUF971 family protein